MRQSTLVGDGDDHEGQRFDLAMVVANLGLKLDGGFRIVVSFL